MPAPIETDAVVIGAGPVGLFQAFQLGLQEIRVHIIDALPHPGGQCVQLYPDKPIYDIPALPVCTGRELTDRLLQQIAPLGGALHLDQEVTALSSLNEADGRPRFALRSSRGAEFLARVVVIAAGVGAFTPRKLRLDGVEALEQRHLWYRLDDAGAWAGRRLLIVGGTQQALQAAIDLATQPDAHRPASVTLLHRRDAFDADASTVAHLRALLRAGALRFVAAQPVGLVSGSAAGSLPPAAPLTLQVDAVDDGPQQLPADALFVLQGLNPRLGPIADWGLALEQRQLRVDPARFETSQRGVFAVGDVNTYPGKRKLIVCGFHEATLAAFACADYVHPNRRLPLQYTTSSPRLHRLLGLPATPTDP